MNQFANTVLTDVQISYTENGAITNENSGNALTDIFFLIGSKTKTPEEMYRLFEVLYGQNKELALRTLFWGRDIRGGAGRRDNFQNILLNLEKNRPDLLVKILPLIPEYGRWKDLWIFKTAEIQNEVFKVYEAGLLNPATAGLAAKYAFRKGAIAAKFRNYMKLSPKNYRKMIVGLTNVVETQMCAKEWGDINYEHVPSVASARYAKAFGRNDQQRYVAYLNSVERGEAKINASSIYPHDVLRTLSKTSQVQWDSLPNYMDGRRVLPMVDVSGSMCELVDGATTAMDIAIALGLYASEKNCGDFKDLVMTFTDVPRLMKLSGDLISRNTQIRQSVGYNTNIQAAFDRILEHGKKYNVPNSEMPEILLVLSDMEFDENAGFGWNMTSHDLTVEKFKQAGYSIPNIVYWNIVGRVGNVPVTSGTPNTALVSGYSPAIMQSILTCKTVTPIDIALAAVMKDRYDLVKTIL